MWSQLLKALESIASIRLPFYRRRAAVAVGQPNGTDARGTLDWKAFLDARALSRVWGPHAQSPWTPFHCLTLFVSLDYLKRETAGPCSGDPWPVQNFHVPGWIDSHTMLMIDLPGPQSVVLGATLAVAGCDLVCTFNNWPYPGGLIKPEETLAALLRYASLLDKERSAFPTPGPVAWLCDAKRLGTRAGQPGEFDNRYYIEDSIIPGTNYLRERDISRIVYVTSQLDTIIADLGVHLDTFKKDGFEVGVAVASERGALLDPVPYARAPRAFNTTGFFRSSAGGFGAPVPHPSSGG